MPDTVLRVTDLIIGRGLLSAETIARELRSRLVARLARRRFAPNTSELLDLARDTLAEFEPMLARNLYETELAGWIAGIADVAKRLPADAIRDVGQSKGGFFGGGTRWPPVTVPLFGDEPPIVKFPLIEAAAKRLLEKQVVTRDEFDALSAELKADAFTVAGQDSTAALEKIRDVLAEQVQRGPSLKQFKDRLAEEIDTSGIGPGHLENVYRTNIQAAYHDGHEQLARNSIVAEIFPYQEYLAIHDARTRPEHLELESLGLSRTGVYRRDDPFWDIFLPPWSWSCRCGVNLLTVEAASRRGVREAQEWMRTGEPPAVPEWRLDKIPFRPDASWSRRRVLV